MNSVLKWFVFLLFLGISLFSLEARGQEGFHFQIGPAGMVHMDRSSRDFEAGPGRESPRGQPQPTPPQHQEDDSLLHAGTPTPQRHPEELTPAREREVEDHQREAGAEGHGTATRRCGARHAREAMVLVLAGQRRAAGVAGRWGAGAR